MENWCPGYYCGRQDINGSQTECGACPRGWRVGSSRSMCRFCDDSPNAHDWMYLGSMAITLPLARIFFVHLSNHKYLWDKRVLMLYVGALVECVAASAVALLSVEPRGLLWSVRSCRVRHLTDWYSAFYNPRPDYVRTIYCGQEAVFPLFSMVLIYYAASLLLLVTFNLFAAAYIPARMRRAANYNTLFALPFMVVAHVCFGGILYYSIPYIVMIVALIAVALHLSTFTDQTSFNLWKNNFVDKENLFIIIILWLVQAFAIVSITTLLWGEVYIAATLCLSPLSTAFYVLTAPFTDTKNLQTTVFTGI